MEPTYLEARTGRPWRRNVALGLTAAIVFVAIAVGLAGGNDKKTSLGNDDSSATTAPDQLSSGAAEDSSETTLSLDDSSTATTSTTLEHTTSTVTPTTTHIDPIPVSQLPDGFPDPGDDPGPPVIADKLIQEFPVPTKKSWPYGITAGPDGAVWFVENGSLAGSGLVSTIGRITVDGKISEYPVHAAVLPAWITTGPDGALWFTEGDSYVGRLTTDGTLKEFAVGSPDFWSITAGPDGALWLALRATDDGGFVVRLTTDGHMTKFKTPNIFTADLAFGPDGNIWAADQAGFISRMTPAGVFTTFEVPFEKNAYGGYVGNIVAGPDGAMWFGWSSAMGSFHSGWIGRVTMSGAFSRFELPTSGDPTVLVVAPDGNIWLTMNNSNVIVRVDMTGKTTSYAVKSPLGIAVGPDGAIWFTETWGNAIGRLSIDLADMFP